MSRFSAIHAPQSLPRLTRATVDRALFVLAMLMLTAVAFGAHPSSPGAAPAPVARSTAR